MPQKHDNIGSETLRRMSSLERYSEWVVERIKPWVGGSVLEVGSGIGNNSRYLLDRKELFLTDINNEYIEILGKKFADYPNVSCEFYNLEESGKHLRGKGIDTIVALNVLEHVHDDTHALREMASILSPGGRVILQIPAHKLLYGSLDMNLDHCRRYTIREIQQKFEASGFTAERFIRINMFGTLGWFLYSRILKREILPKGPLSIFNTLTPVFMVLERIIPVPFGLSIIAVGRKEA